MSDKDSKRTGGGGSGKIAGSISLDPNVVATIAGLAAKDIEGIHSIGKTPLLSFSDNPTRGVATEVGQKQVAVDLDVVIEYGRDLREVARALREKTASEISKMTGREVVEINIHVVDINLPEEEEGKKKSRVV